MSRQLIRQGEGPIASAIRLEQERAERDQKLARILGDAVGHERATHDTDTPELPTHREAPLLLMDPQVRRGFPFQGRTVGTGRYDPDRRIGRNARKRRRDRAAVRDEATTSPTQ